MSKDFEQAYRELAESEIPDLWDRIEAGLENRSTPEGETREALSEKEAGIASDISETPRKAVPAEGKKGQRRSRIIFKRYSGIAAAIVCAAVILPAALVLFRIGNGRLKYNSSGAGDTTEGIDMAAAPQSGEMEAAAAEEESREEPVEEAFEEDTGEMDAGGMAGALDEPAKDGGGDALRPDEAQGGARDNTSDSVQNSAADSAMVTAEEEKEIEDSSRQMDEMAASRKEDKNAGTGSPQQTSGGTMESAKIESASGETGAEGDGMSSGEYTAGTVFEHVVIEVTELQNDFEREDGTPPGTFYTVAVQTDPSGRLTAGEELVVDVPATSSAALPVDRVFEVDLVYRGNGVYGLEGYYQQIDAGGN